VDQQRLQELTEEYGLGRGIFIQVIIDCAVCWIKSFVINLLHGIWITLKTAC
jgi:hypothetical protein